MSIRRIMHAFMGGAPGPKLLPLPVPLWVAFDDTAAERDLGFLARSIEDGMRDTRAAERAASGA